MSETSKSILVIDTPENCESCHLSYSKDYMDMCVITGKYHNISNEKPKWCPLSPLPHRQCMTIYGIGYNQCLDDILKGETK